DLIQAIYGEKNLACDEPTKVLKEMSIQKMLKAAEENEDPQPSLEILIQAENMQDKCEASLKSLTGVKVSHIKIKQYEKYDVTPELMIDGCNNEMEIFSFPFEDESLFDEGSLEFSDSQDDEISM
ncbi:hypothetical protein KI387_015312, partial [Taxus chinensis]